MGIDPKKTWDAITNQVFQPKSQLLTNYPE
jgi:hypothetical protein